jgi:predicted transport protein
MATVEDGLRAQLRNIEIATGHSVDEWLARIRATDLSRHGQIVAWLKSEHGLSHGAANRLALTALAAEAPAPTAGPVAELYAGRSAEVRAIHDRLWSEIERLGAVEVAPKKGYLSLRRRTQFAMIRPAAKHVDLGLVLPGEPMTDRLESAATFNALFTHRVRVGSVSDVDPELVAWLRRAWDRAE